MDAVLGLSVTPSAVGLVLVEGQDADGATMDRDAFPVRTRGRSSPYQTSEKAAAAVLRTEAIAATRGHRLHSIGVTWSDDANTEASLLLKSLTESGFDNVVPVRLPEATEALAWGIAEVIGYETTAVCVLEPDTVIVLIVHMRGGAVQTAINHAIDTDERLIRWLSTVFTRADWQPEALVVVGSGAEVDEMMTSLEDALSVPVFAPAEAQLALARGAALASAHNNAESASVFAHRPENWGERRSEEPRRRWSQGQAGPLAMLAAGAVTFVVSLSIAVSLQLAPNRDIRPVEPQPAAKTSDEMSAAVRHIPTAAPPPEAAPAPLVEAPPSPEAPPVEIAPPPVYSESPVSVPDAPALVSDVPPADAVPPADPALPPIAVAPPQDQLAPPVPPAPVEQPSLLQRIKDRLAGVSEGDQIQPAPVIPPQEPAPPPPVVPPLP